MTCVVTSQVDVLLSPCTEGKGTLLMNIQTPILIVDDDADVRELTHQVLHLAGYRAVLEACDGLEALRLLHDMVAPTVVLCDYQMPQLDGMRVIEALTSDSARFPGHACVFITANAALLSDAERMLLRQQGVPIVHKPFDLDELVAAVEDAAERLDVGASVCSLPLRRRVISGPLAP